MDPNAAPPQTGLRQKIGPLPLWGWGAAAILVFVGYYYWTNRNSSSSSSSDVSGSDGTYNYSEDYSSGYDNGYAAGFNSTGGTTGSTGGSGGTTQTGDAQGPIAHNSFKAKTKDPSGKNQTVKGYGTWIKKGGKWVWQAGIPKQFALPGNGTASGASAATSDVQAAATPQASSPDAATLQDSMQTPGTATLDQATGTASVGTSGGSTTGAVGTTKSGSSGSTGPAQTTNNANRIAQIMKDLANPGPNFTQAQQQQYLASYKSLTGHAYTGKLGQLQVGQHVAYATV